MKRIIFIFFIVNSTYITAQLNHTFVDLHFITPELGYVISEDGFLFKTSDSGIHWVKFATPLANKYSRICFTQKNIGYFISGGYLTNSYLYTTSNAGETWNLNVQLSITPFDIVFISDSVGFISGIQGLIKTTNYGQNWEPVFTKNGANFGFVDKSNGWFYAGTTSYYTTNGGNSWDTVHISPGGPFTYVLDFWIVDNRDMFCMKADDGIPAYYYILYSTNGGGSWNYYSNAEYYKKYCPSIDSMWYLNDFRISRTTNRGVNWTHCNITTKNFSFLDRLHSWAISDTIIYYTDDGWNTFNLKFTISSPTGVQDENLPHKEFTLYQNYPNPFNSSTVIKYELPKQSWVTLKIYDMLGEEIQSLVSSEKESGIHEVAFDASTLTSGIYIYKLQAGEFVESKKMLFLR